MFTRMKFVVDILWVAAICYFLLTISRSAHQTQQIVDGLLK